MTANDHEDTELCALLREWNPNNRPQHNAADRIDTLHAQRADLLERIALAEKRNHSLESIVARDRRSKARLLADLETTTETQGVQHADDWPVKGEE